jgi:hypothetical protein
MYASLLGSILVSGTVLRCIDVEIGMFVFGVLDFVKFHLIDIDTNVQFYTRLMAK